MSTLGSVKLRRVFTAVLAFCAFAFAIGVSPSASAQEALCARVEIRIEQELTFEREGFEARLGVENGTPDALSNFTVVLRFTDEAGEPVVSCGVAQVANPPVDAKFFHRAQPNQEAPATIPAGGSARVAYLIVPAPGAARADDGAELPTGRLYYVGATITYTSAGRTEIVEVTPDDITVRPMPALELQYFLPGDVYGDDPFTSDVVEPMIPFPLGVRVLNHSAVAPARKLQIQSGQPEITANDLGLLVSFRLISTEVNDQPAQPTLLANLGDVAPGRSSVASWMMTASLSGKFIRFEGEISHAPEFGGALTSLIPADAISTRRLLGRVLVDLPGRDGVRDFLATPSMTGDILTATLHESDTDVASMPVPLISGATTSALSGPASARQSTLVVGEIAGPALYVRAPSPLAADKLVHAVRSDGKILPAGNAWLSKTRDEDRNDVYTLNLFDTLTEALPDASYTLTFTDASQENRPPVLQLSRSGSVTVRPGVAFSLLATATDPDATIPVLSTGLLPDGAQFADAGDGTGLLTWTPSAGQIGDYVLLFRAADAAGAAVSRTLRVIVDPTVVSGYEAWSESHWPGVTDPAIIGSGADPDGDGFDNLLEYALDGDPTRPDDSILPRIGLVEHEGARYLALTYRHRTDDSGLVFEVVASTSAFAPLSAWTVQTAVVSSGDPDAVTGLREVVVRDSIPVEAGEPQRYLRLRVTRPTP